MIYNTFMKLNAKELRDVDETDIVIAEKIKSIKRRPMYFILENIYDTYNIGGLFRLADALAIKKMYICGESEIPPNSKIKKASIGTYKVVPWEYRKTVGEAIKELKSKLFRDSDFGFRISIIAVEQAKNSIPYQKADYSAPVALILGNETYGVTEETLALADQIVEIPMWGINKSLNVIVSAAIVSYWAIRL
ncbi:RNA methyltransferase [Candidatus Roizmanbacteria bacterium CG_4_9_14_3_um_filter_33_18]|uniref:RNA methyltransferase n=3 Tax=Candidatus Roizmaniibacteriota TaxID=1752723 RepID=A0A2M7U9N9_9BACT|nr:MAG: RNA methyltransferase [Candidatus Roizmanbacteria bacterium CG22_combo_CG10-13_8_21_14_all_34_12]PIZ67947.1 MAG: RNA methyltransferase [Candidatus Roizmanbacteria bacterium CG_4_10_14_0_2_um_filter_33_96]PJA55434.1 MAG: RNA methyltransferase [Candidatus Roizmanbacteria bacterium CG_4_9_14_3_um_filter_33_18]